VKLQLHRADPGSYNGTGTVVVDNVVYPASFEVHSTVWDNGSTHWYYALNARIFPDHWSTLTEGDDLFDTKREAVEGLQAALDHKWCHIGGLGYCSTLERRG
jgi:hypothetical protein